MQRKYYKAIILDMNGTFMFGHDRFAPDQDYFRFYQTLSGQLTAHQVNEILTNVYNYLAQRYDNPAYEECFPTLAEAIQQCHSSQLAASEIEKLSRTFAYFEMGQVPPDYFDYIHRLSGRYKLAAVIDIWAPPQAWLSYFRSLGLWDLFEAVSFSSLHGMVKPSPKPFRQVLDRLSVADDETMVVGDNPERDLLGAQRAGLDCVLVGGARHDSALACIDSLLQLDNILNQSS